VAIPVPASTAEAVEMYLTSLRHLASADPTALAAAAQAQCLQAFEQGDAISTAARARFLAAFTAGQGYSEDADYSPTSWLIHRTGITKGAARAHRAWARRAIIHPQVVAALAEGTVLSESMARALCGWTDKLPEDCRGTADEILVAAARAGARKEDLAALAAEIYARSLPDGEDDPEPDFEDRQLRVETTFAGAGVISGDLTPDCAAVVTAVLESLSAPRGAEDTRTREQRYHDALQDAMRRLIASGLLPERAGQPVRVWAHVTLAELRALDDGSVLQQEWIGEMAIRWAARRAAASQTGGDGAAWLDGKPARAISCDATMTPVVTGGVDPAALDELVALCLQYAGHGPHCAARPGTGRTSQPGQESDAPGAECLRDRLDPARTSQPPDPLNDPGPAADPPSDPDPAADLSGGSDQPADQPGDPDPCADPPGGPDLAGTGQPADPPDDPDPIGPADLPGGGNPRPPGPRPPTAQAEEMLRHAIIRTAINLVSGPGGLASFLRTRLLGARLAGPSLPLDVGHSAEIPAAIRRAVILRDQHCRWAGGCDQPAAACEAHHVTHLADGGTSSVDGCALYCFYHHHVAIHQQGWTVALHPDGTTTARSPDGTKVFHSHGPPPGRPG
jgi:Domain of unknown function (DUF222)